MALLLPHNDATRLLGQKCTRENDCWAPDQAGSKIPDVSGLNAALFSSLESSLMSPRLFTSSDIYFNQTDIPADRNLPPTYAG